MVYGEYIQKPAVELTKLLAKNLPYPLENTYLVNSGTEAIEGALKLAKRATGRSEIIAAHNAPRQYHGFYECYGIRRTQTSIQTVTT